MHIPEILFSLPLLKDRKTQQIEHVTRTRAVSGTSSLTAFADLFDVPADRFFVVTHVGCAGSPEFASGGLLQYVALEAVEISAPNTTAILATFARGTALAGSVLQMAAGGMAIWVGPNVRLRAYAFWSTESATHVSSLSVSGLSIPRGNMARG